MTTVKLHRPRVCSFISYCCQGKFLTCHKEMILQLCTCPPMFPSETVELDNLSFFFKPRIHAMLSQKYFVTDLSKAPVLTHVNQ